MKTVQIKLIQSADNADAFKVTAFRNTAELQVGQLIPRDRLRLWCTYPLVDVQVVGVEQRADEQGLLADEPDNQIARINPLSPMAGVNLQ